jgi:hypothetical protein
LVDEGPRGRFVERDGSDANDDNGEDKQDAKEDGRTLIPVRGFGSGDDRGRVCWCGFGGGQWGCEADDKQCHDEEHDGDSCNYRAPAAAALFSSGLNVDVTRLEGRWLGRRWLEGHWLGSGLVDGGLIGAGLHGVHFVGSGGGPAVINMDWCSQTVRESLGLKEFY